MDNHAVFGPNVYVFRFCASGAYISKTKQGPKLLLNTISSGAAGMGPL